MKVLAAPLDAVSRQARPYPAYLLSGCETGLCLFAAAFLGHNDAIHMARAELATTCVDTDVERLDRMKALYPADWLFVPMDAWEFGEAMRNAGWTWDAVSVDTFRGDATERSMATLDLWCSLANRVVTATVEPDSEYVIPDGWRAEVFERSPKASWLVLIRA